MSSYIDLAGGGPGMLIPVFSAPSTNLPYVQQQDEFCTVVAFQVFLDFEHYSSIASSDAFTTSIGSPGAIAFRGVDGVVRCLDMSQSFAYVESNKEALRQSPLLNLALLRITGSERRELQPAWEAASAFVSADPGVRTGWVRSESRLFQNGKVIWERLNLDSPARKATAKSLEATRLSPERMLHWLKDRTHFELEHWSAVWHQAYETSPSDERLIDVAQSWIASRHSDGASFSAIHSVLIVVADHVFGRPNAHEAISDIITEYLQDDISFVFEFIRPISYLHSVVALVDSGQYPELFIDLAQILLTNAPTSDALTRLVISRLQELGAARAPGPNPLPPDRSNTVEALSAAWVERNAAAP